MRYDLHLNARISWRNHHASHSQQPLCQQWSRARQRRWLAQQNRQSLWWWPQQQPAAYPSKNVSTGLLIVSVLCASLLGACGSSAPKWRKSGADSFAAENDLSQCRYEIRTKRLSASEANAALYDCMQAKGYRKR